MEEVTRVPSAPQDDAPARRSVAELAGRFKSSTRPHDAPGNETQEKPVRRRPPHSLQLPKTHGDEEEPPGVTSPLPTKAKRNSALIEKLQANLALSPTALLPSPKSPGFRLLSPAFNLPSAGNAPVTTVTTVSTVTTSSPATPTSPVTPAFPLTEEEGPVSFEAPPTVAEGSILSNTNIKARARHSIKRRPPSRRHRKSSSGDEVGVTVEGGNASLSSPTEPGDTTTAGGEKEEEEVFKNEEKTAEKDESHGDESKISVKPRREGEEEEGSTGGEEGNRTSGRKDEDDEDEEETNTDSKEKRADGSKFSPMNEQTLGRVDALQPR